MNAVFHVASIHLFLSNMVLILNVDVLTELVRVKFLLIFGSGALNHWFIRFGCLKVFSYTSS